MTEKTVLAISNAIDVVTFEQREDIGADKLSHLAVTTLEIADQMLDDDKVR